MRFLVADIRRALYETIHMVTEDYIYYNFYLISFKFNDFDMLSVNLKKKSSVLIKEDTSNNFIFHLVNPEPDMNTCMGYVISKLRELISEKSLIAINFHLSNISSEQEARYFKALRCRLGDLRDTHRLLYAENFFYNFYRNDEIIERSFVIVNRNNANYIVETTYKDRKVFIMLEVKKVQLINLLRRNQNNYNLNAINLADPLKESLFDMLYEIHMQRIRTRDQRKPVMSDIDTIEIFREPWCISNKFIVEQYQNELAKVEKQNELVYNESEYLTIEHLKCFFYKHCIFHIEKQNDHETTTWLINSGEYIMKGYFTKRELANNTKDIQYFSIKCFAAIVHDYCRDVVYFEIFPLFISTVPRHFINKFYARVCANPCSFTYRVFVELLFESRKIDIAIYTSLLHVNCIETQEKIMYNVLKTVDETIRNALRNISFTSLIYDFTGKVNAKMVLFIYKVLNEIVLEALDESCESEWLMVIQEIGNFYNIRQDINYLFKVIREFCSLYTTDIRGVFYLLQVPHYILTYFNIKNIGRQIHEINLGSYRVHMERVMAEARDDISSYQGIKIPEKN